MNMFTQIVSFQLQTGIGLAPAIEANREIFDSFSAHNQAITQVILSALADKFHLHGPSRFESRHQAIAASKTALGLLHYPAYVGDDSQFGHNKHTDLGTLTVLYTRQWGLQVYSSNEGEWQWVQPLEGHAIVNVGDTLRFLSDRRLRSAIHKVIPVGKYQEESRYAIAYFLRADDEARLVSPEGRIITAKDWHDHNYEVFRQTHDKQALAFTLTGGMEA
jgi:isopenicillin N synthase-like dioxygenase